VFSLRQAVESPSEGEGGGAVTESWKTFPDWEGLYEVSDLGGIRSLPRQGGGSRWYRSYGGALVKPFIASTGYLSVNLTRRGKRKQELVHRAVLRAFIGEAPEGYECCHANGNRTDARLENLRWDTRKNNHADKLAHGTWQCGTAHGNAKLDECVVWMLRHDEISVDYVAAQYGVRRKTVAKIKGGRGWAHV